MKEENLKFLAKKIAGDSSNFCDIVEYCVVSCGWKYDKKNRMWIVSYGQFCVLNSALHLAAITGLGSVEWLMDKVGQPKTYKLITMAWSYASPLIQLESLRWINEVIHA